MPKRLFIVDDDKMYLRILEQQFAESDFEVSTFSTGEECLHDTRMPDFLVVDYYLNSEKSDAINGLETIRRIRERVPTLPVIVMSGRADLSGNSKHDYLMSYLNMGDRSGMADVFESGGYFYLIKNNGAPSQVKEILKKAF